MDAIVTGIYISKDGTLEATFRIKSDKNPRLIIQYLVEHADGYGVFILDYPVSFKHANGDSERIFGEFVSYGTIAAVAREMRKKGEL